MPMDNSSKVKNTMIWTMWGFFIGWLMNQGRASSWNDQTALMWGAIVAVLVGGFGYWMTPYLQSSTTRQVSLQSALMSVFFIIVWIIPMTITGAVQVDSVQAELQRVPVAIRNQYRISCLFTHASRSWPTIHYEVRFFGQMAWQEGPLEGYFDLDIFGYRSRFNRIVSASRHKNDAGEVVGKNRIRLEEIGVFIADRWAELNPEDPPVQEVRLTEIRHKVGGEHCMAREAWSRPPLSSIPEKDRNVIHTVKIKPKVQKSIPTRLPLQKLPIK